MTLMTKRKFSVAILLAVCVLAQRLPAQPSGLSIVVIEGEGAVNIIQQKTAVRALVEVRDRNDLPVSGVAVTFSVGGQGASFAGGASTLTVTTNAGGQAVVAGLTPTATGAVTINASAIVNGQTIAATITQTNVATAAEAAASAASGGSGAGSAAGAGGGASGGLGTGAIIGVVAGGAAVAAGAVAGSGLLKDILKPGVEGREPPCVFTITPAETTISVPAAGATIQITIVVSPTPCENATWNATSGNATFVTVNPSSGNGNSTVTVTIPPFTQLNANPPRTFNVAIAFSGQKIFQFIQAGGAD